MTDWELGNEILCKIMDGMSDLANECKDTHPKIAAELLVRRDALIETYKKLVGDEALI